MLSGALVGEGGMTTVVACELAPECGLLLALLLYKIAEEADHFNLSMLALALEAGGLTATCTLLTPEDDRKIAPEVRVRDQSRTSRQVPVLLLVLELEDAVVSVVDGGGVEVESDGDRVALLLFGRRGGRRRREDEVDVVDMAAGVSSSTGEMGPRCDMTGLVDAAPAGVLSSLPG